MTDISRIKLSNAQIAWRAAQDIEDGAYVNLGIGFPEMVARFQPEGKQAIFHHADSFAMVRGGHLDVAILGAYQVAQNGDLANWSTGKGGIPAVGGAMDLVQSAKRIAVLTDHVTKDGSPKLVDRCTLPLTGVACVTRIYSSLAVVDVVDGHFVLREQVAGLSFDDLQALTGAPLHVEGDVATLTCPEDLA